MRQPCQPSSSVRRLSQPLRSWWQQMTQPDPAMSDTVYDLLLARFCGPATSVEIASVTASHRAVKTGKGKGKGKKGKACPATKVLRTAGEGVAEAGLILSTLALYPNQVALLSDPALRLLYLCGPPGTGKTVMVVVKAIQELHQGHNVLVLSTKGFSRTVSTLIEAQLLHAIGPNPPPGTGSVYLREEKDFAQPEDMVALASAAGNLFVIVDEIYITFGNSTLWKFIVLATSSLPGVSVWSTGPFSLRSLPGGMVERMLTVPLRTPPAVTSLAQTAIGGTGMKVPAYTALPVRAATDGAPVRWLEEHSAGLRGHNEGDIRDCEECAHNIVLLLTELGVGSSTGAAALRYRDVLILGYYDDVTPWGGMRRALSARGVPSQILDVTDETSRRDVALALTDAVTLADQRHVTGLERRVVIVLHDVERARDDGGGADLGCYWPAVSRCTGQLAVIRLPPYMLAVIPWVIG